MVILCFSKSQSKMKRMDTRSTRSPMACEGFRRMRFTRKGGKMELKTSKKLG